MARKRKQDATPPLFELELAKEPRHFDEANVARLGLISIQERIPEGYASWEEEFEVLGKPVKLACYANPNVGGVPHGLDNEVSLALIALYLNAGSPPDGTFTTTAYQILKLMGFDTSGYYYRALKESLLRLTTATYVLSEAWEISPKNCVTHLPPPRLAHTVGRRAA
nr:replication initiator protein A [Thermus thermophilus]